MYAFYYIGSKEDTDNLVKIYALRSTTRMTCDLKTYRDIRTVKTTSLKGRLSIWRPALSKFCRIEFYVYIVSKNSYI